jgi:copper chaperone CopZ
MTRSWIALMLIGTVLCISGCASKQASQLDRNTDVLTYEVFGMDCPGCHGGLEKNLLKIPGVVDARANWKTNRVIIEVKEGITVSEADIEHAVSISNFTMGKRIE